MFEGKSIALTEAKRMLKSIQLNGIVQRAPLPPANFSFREVAEKWFEEQETRVELGKKRPITLETNSYRLAALLTYFGDQDIAWINETETEGYQRHRLVHPVSAATINSETRLLKQIMGSAFKKQLITRPLDVEPLPERRKRTLLPTQEEVVAILNHLLENVRLLVHFLAETGCRSGEAFSLNWEGLDEENNIVSIWSDAEFEAKTDESNREVAISRAPMEAIVASKSSYLASLGAEEAPSQLVFRGRGGGRMWDFRKSLTTAIKRAGVNRNGVPLHLTAKSFRKAHATWLAETGIGEAIIQSRLGHAPGSSVTRKHYIEVQNKKARSAAVIDLAQHRDKLAS